ncbi:hypothetical protein KTH_27860 [Thermosporothrix hazakensis]|nr:hypothetical protein KTC_44790 [Thermosporothrix sp. COM3]GCE47917.1 hypothetical protein KTH_27860 [Thermosporothrix hazakensis]
MSWSLYRFGDFQIATQKSALWVWQLENMVREASSSVEKDQIATLLCQFYQVAAASARDRGSYRDAVAAANQAVKLAEQLNNPSLLASSLYHRFRVFIQWDKYPKATNDVEHAHSFIQRLPDTLKCSLYSAAGEAYTYRALYEKDKQAQVKSLHMFDKAAEWGRKHNNVEVGNGLFSGLYKPLVERAYSLADYGEINDATECLVLAESNIKPNNLCGLKDYYLSLAKISIEQGDVEAASEAALKCLELHHDTTSKSNVGWLHQIYKQCQKMEPNNRKVLKFGNTLSAYVDL